MKLGDALRLLEARRLSISIDPYGDEKWSASATIYRKVPHICPDGVEVMAEETEYVGHTIGVDAEGALVRLAEKVEREHP